MGQVLLALMFAFPAPVAAWSPATPPPESVSNNASVVHAGLPPVPGGVGRIAASAVAMHGKVYLLGGYTVDAQKAEASLANVDAYPGQYDLNETGQPVLVDRARLDLFLQTVRSFAAENHLPVAFTEFGSHRTAPNVATYLQDRIDLQDPIGNWAVWTWQPAGFADPFSMHDPSAAHDVLRAAWNTNCAGP